MDAGITAGEMSVAVKHLSSGGDLNTRRQERRINIPGASNRSSKSLRALSSADLLHAADGSAKMAEIIMGSQYDNVQDMLAIFGKHDIVNLYTFSDLAQMVLGFVRFHQVWGLLKCVKLILLGSIDDGVSQ